jgi:hypothetical protein
LIFLLDTHVFFWFQARSRRLSDEAAAVIRRGVERSSQSPRPPQQPAPEAMELAAGL